MKIFLLMLIALVFLSSSAVGVVPSDDFWDKCPGPACPSNKPVDPDSENRKKEKSVQMQFRKESEIIEKERKLLEREKKLFEREQKLKER